MRVPPILLTLLLAFAAAPLPAQQVSDLFPAEHRFETTPMLLASPERPSAITPGKIVGAVGGTLAGAVVVGQATYVLSGDDPYLSVLGALVGAAVGAGLGAYVPGESPPHAAPTTFALAGAGSVAAIGLIFIVPPLAWAAPPAGALLGFSMAY